MEKAPSSTDKSKEKTPKMEKDKKIPSKLEDMIKK